MRLPLLLPAFLLALTAARVSADPISELWSTREEFPLGPSPAAADINGDGRLEIVLVDGSQDRIAVFDSVSGQPLWVRSFTVAGDFLSSAAVGQFLGDGSVDIAAVSSSGTLLCVDGLTGELLGQRELEFPPATPMSVAPLVSPADVPSDFREAAALIDTEGLLRVFQFSRDETPDIVYQLRLGGASDNPPVLARLGGSFPDPGFLLLTEQGRLTVAPVVDRLDRTQPSFTLLRETLVKTFMAAGDLTGDGWDDLVVADDRGWLSAFTSDGTGIRALWPPVSIVQEPATPLILVDANSDRRADILIHRDNELLLVNGATGRMDIWPADPGAYVHESSISSPPSAFQVPGGRALAAFCDISGRVWLLDLATGTQVQSAAGEPVRYDVRGANAARTTLLAGPLSGTDRLDLLLLGSRSGKGVMLATEFDAPAAGAAWRGAQGGPWRTGGVPPKYAEYADRAGKASEVKFQHWLELARQAADERKWMEVLAHGDAALAIRPQDPEAWALRNRALSSANRGKRLLTIVLVLAALTAAAVLGGRTAFRLVRLGLARAEIRAGRKKEALAHLKAVHRAAPRHKGALRQLADLCVELKEYNAETAPILERACVAFPLNDGYAKALAYAYSAEGRRDAKAAEAYSAMVRVVSHPGPWAFTLGQTWVQLGEDAKALEAFHLALRHGFENPELDEALAGLYVRMECREPEILPILRRVLERHLHDPAFLRIYCLCVARAREYDDQAESAAQRLVELEPESAAGNFVLATRLLQAGRPAQALRHAESFARAQPEDGAAHLLLAETSAALGRTDAEARGVYERALRSRPDARNIRAALARIYAAESRDDTTAQDLYIGALDNGVAEPDFLERTARIGAAQGNDELLVRSAEALRRTARPDDELTLALARAYLRRGAGDDEMESTLREAFALRPQDPGIALGLARVYIARNRTDADAIAVYEAACAREPKPIEVVHQLIKAYSDSQVSERALVLAREFLEKHPGDSTLMKLAADASAALDHLDEAIADYERILRDNPDDGEAVCRLAALYQRKERDDEAALRMYSRAIEFKPDNLDLHAALARGEARRKNWDGVVGTVKHFLTAAPRRIDAAIGLMKTLAENSPEAAGLQWFLIETMILTGQLPAALDQIGKVVQSDPANVQQALAAYEKIIDRQPDQAAAHQQRGRLLVRLGRLSEGRQALERAQRIDPRSVAIVEDLIVCYEKMLEAREALDIRLKLGRLALRLSRYDLAISCFQRTDKDERWANESIRALGQCFLAKGMLDLALQEFKKLEVDDEIKALFYRLGLAYEAAGDPRGAREAYKAIYAEDIGYQDVKVRLDALVKSISDPNSPERTAIISSLSEAAKTRYDLIQELGRGAMGIVYKARDNELEEIVALKILPESLEKNPSALAMFRQEARNARRLAHNGIVRIHDIGEERGRKYISMEFVDGIDLKQRLIETKRNLPFEETLHYAKQIAAAMSAAHAAHIVHRDLKPANIMLTKQRRVKVTDFGIAKLIAEETHTTNPRNRTVVGTPLYMAPEQVKGEFVDHRADIYSMGIVFYEMASGRPPFIEGDLAYHHVSTPPKPLPDDVPADFARIVMKCLEKKPEDRWSSAEEVLAELEKVKSGASDTEV